MPATARCLKPRADATKMLRQWLGYASTLALLVLASTSSAFGRDPVTGTKEPQAAPTSTYTKEWRDNWRVTLPDGSHSENFASRFIEGQDQKVRFHYQTTVTMPTSNQGPMFAILPPIWVNFSLAINGKIVAPMPQSFSGGIYAYRIIPLLNTLNPGENRITIKTNGPALYSGFRGDGILITNDPKVLKHHALLNFVLNDIHGYALILSFLLAIATLQLLPHGANRPRKEALFCGIIGCFPYMLLTTPVYGILGLDGLVPFALQLAAQTMLWPSLICFGVLIQSRESKARRILLRHFKPGYLFIAPGLTLAAGLLGGQTVLLAVFYFFVIPIVVTSLWSMFLPKKNVLITLGYALACLSFYYTGYADFIGGVFYPAVWGLTILYIIGFGDLVNDIAAQYRLGSVLNDFTEHFIPQSTYQGIRQNLASHTKFAELIEVTSGKSNLAIILVDICDWGRLNSYHDSRIPPALVAKARSVVFVRTEEIFSRYQLELIKSDGDNLKFACGLLIQDSADRTPKIARKSLGAIRELLDTLNDINAQLRGQNLPIVQVKISATFGLCDYGIDKYTNRCLFDIRGHSVNMAYRLEAAMNESFYEVFGKNVALISTTLTEHCDDIDLLARFSERYAASDKHGYDYDCYVARHMASNISLADFSQAAFSLFKKHTPEAKPSDPTKDQSQSPSATNQSPSATNQSPSATAPPNPIDSRQGVRQAAYRGERIMAAITCQQGHIQGNVVDLSDHSLGIMVAEDHQAAQLVINQIVPLRLKFRDQDISYTAAVKSIAAQHTDQGTFQRLGLKLLDTKRQTPDRREQRFDCSKLAFPPTLSTQNPLSFGDQLDFRIIDLSPHGLALRKVQKSVCLLTGVHLKCQIHFPFIGNTTVTIIIRHSGKSDPEIVGASIVGDTSTYQEMASSYLLKADSARYDLSALKRAGFDSGKVTPSLTYRYATTPAEMQRTLQLRLATWQAEGDFADVNDPALMADEYDQHSRHLQFFVGEKLVASARIVFNNGDPQRVEHGSYGCPIPKDLSDKRFVEFSRIVIDPHYRGADLFINVLFHMARITIEADHTHVMMSCNDSLMSYYKRFGFKESSRFTMADDPAAASWILATCDLAAAIGGQQFVPVGWTLGLDELHRQLRQLGALQTSLRGRLQSKVLDFARPIVKEQIKKKRGKRDKSPSKRGKKLPDAG